MRKKLLALTATLVFVLMMFVANIPVAFAAESFSVVVPTFDPLGKNYTQPAEQEIVITNTGPEDIHNAEIKLALGDVFTLVDAGVEVIEISGITINRGDSYIVKIQIQAYDPVEIRFFGTYEDVLTVSGGGETITNNLSVEIKPTVTYVMGTGAADQTTLVDVNSNLALVNPTDMGVTAPPATPNFVGWAQSDEQTSGLLQSGNSLTIKDDTTLWAKWAADTYTVSFVNENNEKVYDDILVANGSEIILPIEINRPAKIATFHWIDVNNNDNIYSAGDKYTPTADTVLMTSWSDVKYTVTFDYNLTGVSPIEISAPVGNSIVIPALAYNNTVGWRSAGGTAYNPNDVYIPTMDEEFNAIWDQEANLCTVLSLFGEGQEADTLRKYRDDVLSQSEIGQYLTEKYYELSPNIIAAMEENPLFENMVRFNISLFANMI